MKQNLIKQIKCRISEAEYEKIITFCEKNSIKLSSFMRTAIEEYMRKEGE